ncbi:hypothetical protein [Benzoatithermus flavus]|uniref:Phage protein n=1 Tax=Benzoatithermus flavus TaxID=3108223 RepID=A0ABU8XNI7_9PROT
MTTTISVDDALNFILTKLRTEGPAKFDRDGFDFWVSDYAARYLEEVQGIRPRPPIEDQRTYDASVPFFDAAWELARRGILRPSVRNSFMQWAARYSTGGGYTLTQIGAEWLAGLDGTRLSIRDDWGPFAGR